MRIVRLLVGNPPQTMAHLVAATGVTRTAITEQLNELIEAGYIHRSIQRSGRGRPRHLFEATDSALKLLFGDNQRLVAPVLLRAIAECGGAELRQSVLSKVSAELAEHYRAQITAVEPAQRLRQLAEALQSEGVLVEVEVAAGKCVLRERTCPYIDLVDESRAVCGVEEQMMSAVVGAQVRMVACRLDGCPGCAFELETVELGAAHS